MRRDLSRLEDIRNAAKRAAKYIDGLTLQVFPEDEKTQAAVVRELEIVGEAASRVTEGMRSSNPQVPWARLTRLRNFYIHAYDVVDYTRVWETVTIVLPRVESGVAAVISAQTETPES